jgi:AraC-like DNA-binding protein
MPNERNPEEYERHLRLAQTNRLLKEKLLRWMAKTGDYPTAITGLSLHRRDEVDQAENCFYTPVVAVVLQGFKRSVIGSEEYHYGENHCLINGVDIPSVNHITDASPEKPFLVMSLNLDSQLITQLVAEIPRAFASEYEPFRGVAVADVDPNVLDAFLRLAELLDNPEQIPVLAPMIIREIHYRLLAGPQGRHLRSLNTIGSQSNRVFRALTWLRQNFKEPFLIEELSKKANMAASTFHRHFRHITTLSPLQYQKRLRLYEAQRLMLVENADATSACLSVGYESPTQFNREYKRLFGAPPHSDIRRKRHDTDSDPLRRAG